MALASNQLITNSGLALITFTIPGRIRGKGRIRHLGRQHFMDAKTRETEATIRFYAGEAMCGKMPIAGPVSLHVTAIFNPPTSWSDKKRMEARYVTGTPDPDNQLKAIFDACNRIVWNDDRQISVISFQRHYELNEPERVIVTVHDLSERPFVRVAA